MIISVLKETSTNEHRVALVPDAVGRLVKEGLTVLVETQAGVGASFSDALYASAGATIIGTTTDLFTQTDVIVKVSAPSSNEVNLFREGSALIGLLNPTGNLELITQLAARKITAFSLEFLPRISRAQSMDVLSSQATCAGYKAVLIAALRIGKFFPMLTTAAGTITPAKVLIVGVGVAGLQAIATARRLGAVVEAFDIRPEVKEQIQSLGAKAVEIPIDEDARGSGGYAKEVSATTKQKIQETLARHVAQSDVVITAAQVPGKKAPLLVTDLMIAAMKPGSVIVDLAAEQGGNCAGTEPGRDIDRGGVTIIGPINLPASMSIHASQMYSRNVITFLLHLIKENAFAGDSQDEIVRETLITRDGVVTHPRLQHVEKIR